VSVVLVVDDEPTIRRLVAAILTQSGRESMTAPDAETAMRAIIDRKPDAIITDIRLPGMDGVAFARWVRDDDRFADMPVAFISAWEDAPAFAQPPPVTYFRKPFDVDALLEWVSAVCPRDDHA
jgi:Response regulator containing CheY-like receiver, AAA-type ATPase, and DNA-binding domains